MVLVLYSIDSPKENNIGRLPLKANVMPIPIVWNCSNCMH